MPSKTIECETMNPSIAKYEKCQKRHLSGLIKMIIAVDNPRRLGLFAPDI
ncbi:MAG: hypothetical protein GKS07_09725 [Nitrosopumilus sp.]|nr:MAG: hypothetical protein GKS07_09725 [Nitrosopumilus sp.]